MGGYKQRKFSLCYSLKTNNILDDVTVSLRHASSPKTDMQNQHWAKLCLLFTH
jgi:hypothetical protein